MRRLVLLVFCLSAMVSICHAEPRWCSVLSRNSSDVFTYPQFAILARVSGIVVSRMIFSPGGKMEKLEPISGPPLLSTMLRAQIEKWTLRTDATGDEPCQTIVIAEFDLDNSATQRAEGANNVEAPTAMHLFIATESIPVETVVTEY